MSSSLLTELLIPDLFLCRKKKPCVGFNFYYLNLNTVQQQSRLKGWMWAFYLFDNLHLLVMTKTTMLYYDELGLKKEHGIAKPAVPLMATWG